MSDPVRPSPAMSSRPSAGGMLASLVDFSFRRSIVADGAGVIYGLWIAAVLAHWLLWIVLSAMIGFSTPASAYWADTPRAPWLPVLVILLGWIPALLAIGLGRAALELITATVRTARDTRRTVEVLEQLAAQPTDHPAVASPARTPLSAQPATSDRTPR